MKGCTFTVRVVHVLDVRMIQTVIHAILDCPVSKSAWESHKLDLLLHGTPQGCIGHDLGFVDD